MEWFCYVKGFFAVLFIGIEFLAAVFAFIVAVGGVMWLFERVKETRAAPVLRALGIGTKYTFFTVVALFFCLLLSAIVYGATETVCRRGFWHTVSHPFEQTK